MSRRPLYLALITALSLFVPGCAAVPVDGPVTFHPAPAVQDVSDVRIAPLGPADGADQLLIVEGFLHAMGVYQEGYPVAREYLTEEASAAWDPDAGVSIYQTNSDEDLPQKVGDNVVINASLSGQVDADGSYRQASGRAPHDFQLVQDGRGQWRISNPPTGLLVSRYQFSNGWVNVDLHFGTPSGGRLATQPVTLADGDDLLDRALARQLAGPGSWLAPVVRPHPRLTLAGVTVSSGIAEIEIGAEGAVFADETRANIVAELVYTATQFSQVSQVRVTCAGQYWSASGPAAFTYTRADLPQYNPTPPGAEFYYLADGEVQVLGRQATVFATGLDWNAFAVELGGAAAAGVNATGIARLDGAGPLAEVAAGAELLRPDFGPDGELWTGIHDINWRVFAGGAETPVSVEGDPIGLRAFQLAPDGLRVAAVLDYGEGSKLAVLRVRRTAEGIAVSAAQELQLTGAKRYLDVGFSTPTELNVLVQRQSDETAVVRVSIDGAWESDLGPVARDDLVELAVVPGALPVVRTSAGTVLRLNAAGTDWSEIAAGATAIAYS